MKEEGKSFYFIAFRPPLKLSINSKLLSYFAGDFCLFAAKWFRYYLLDQAESHDSWSVSSIKQLEGEDSGCSKR